MNFLRGGLRAHTHTHTHTLFTEADVFRGYLGLHHSLWAGEICTGIAKINTHTLIESVQPWGQVKRRRDE